MSDILGFFKNNNLRLTIIYEDRFVPLILIFVLISYIIGYHDCPKLPYNIFYVKSFFWSFFSSGQPLYVEEIKRMARTLSLMKLNKFRFLIKRYWQIKHPYFFMRAHIQIEKNLWYFFRRWVLIKREGPLKIVATEASIPCPHISKCVGNL